MIPCQRDLFDIPDDVAYFNCAYMSPLLRAAADAGDAGLRRKSRPWGISPADFFNETDAARGLFSRLINASADDIAVIPSASYGLAVAAANMVVNPGQKMLVLAEQFPSNVYPWRDLAREKGATLTTVERPEDGDWTAAILRAIDADTALAALPHCHWTDGGIIDLVEVSTALRGVGAALVVDVTQSLGALPLDVQAVRPNFLSAACYKWLMGPYSIGFLYAAPEHQAGRPIEHNWASRANAEDFSGLVNYEDAFMRGARRFDVGERSNFALLPAAMEAIKQLLIWGVPEIQQTLRAMTNDIAAKAGELGLSSIPSNLRAGHFLGLRFPGGIPKGLAERLAAERVYVSVRGDSMPVTPHVYNAQSDIDKLFGVLGSVV